MNCQKTGAHIYIHQYGMFAICDVFIVKEVFIFRIAATSMETIRGDIIHYEVLTIEEWFDRKVNNDDNSTLISCAALYHGYEGKSMS